MNFIILKKSIGRIKEGLPLDIINFRKIPDLMNILLKDRTTRKNIIWATNSYEKLGDGYKRENQIKINLITNGVSQLVKPRSEKAIEEQKERTRGKAEVFTPTWIVQKQNDLIENEYKNLPLDEYVDKKWLEITCGEAPYMCNRYDMVTGEIIPINERVGFVDRKLQRISKEIDNLDDWLKYAYRAYEASYGYEFHGDSLLLARENLLQTFIDYYINKYGKNIKFDYVYEVAKIISYNVFQMDGLNYTVPFSETLDVSEPEIQLDLFGNFETDGVQLEMNITEGKKVSIKDWVNNKMTEFESLTLNERSKQMKFDVVIGNPPYQEEAIGTNNQSQPIYNLFIDESRKIADKALLITPARFLANTGATPKKWNKKMLQDEHMNVVYHEIKSSKVFPNTDIKGGIVITYYDNNKVFKKIGTFIPYKELRTAFQKVEKMMNNNIGEWVFSPDSYKLSDLMFEENPNLLTRTDKSHRKAVSSNVFERYPEIFFDEEPDDENDYVQIYGRLKGKRVYKYIKKEYLEEHTNLNKWKVFVPGANGSGAIGETLSTPVIGSPVIGHNQTFISIGALETQFEGKSLFKYIKTKFTRAMLGIMKTTQNNQSKRTWSKIPLQDFTSNSDIDWSKSIAEIDQQLYKKYGLSKEEIDFIETNVKEMK